MNISFHGADQQVTGSCHKIECNGKHILIDCGMFQGSHELAEDNAQDFGFDPSSIDFLLLTHAHLDHCGRIPLLAKQGFKGEIITTAASRELAHLVLLDSAHLQEEEAAYQSRKLARKHNHSHHKEIQPLYNVLDTLNSMDYFGRIAHYNTPMEIAPGIQVTFLDAGHILGSASIFIELEENGDKRSILFSGDLGYSGRVLLRDPVVSVKADIVVMETTYGDRLHKQLQPSIDELYDNINDTFHRGGNVIIPTFALERAQELLYFLHQGVEQGQLSASMQVFLDSPMAISATDIFQHHPECYNTETAKLFQQGKNPFSVPGLHYTRETAQSIALNNINGGAVIMAGSGMCTGGRVRHHLKYNLWRENCTVIFVGYAAIGTLARRIIDGAKTVHIFQEEIPVRAKIITIGGFSAHADRNELLHWHQQTGEPQRTYLVHGEKETMKKFSRLLHKTKIIMPRHNEAFSL